MSENFNFFLPLSKVEKTKDGGCMVAGYASTPALDIDGEIVSLDAIKKALPGYWQWRNVREMHQSKAVGVAQEANIDTKGLFLTSKITDKDAAQKCIDEVYKGYSIGGRKLAKTGNTITEIELVEISLVDRPANPECRLEVQKSAKNGGSAHLIKAAKEPKDDLTRALRSMAKVAEHLVKVDGNPPATHDGLSLPAIVKGVLCKTHGLGSCDKCSCAKHAAVDCEKCTLKLVKREFNAEQRRRAAASGAALPDGSFPIANQSDLDNAVRLAGHAKDKSAARKHIISRAKSLGLKLPDAWAEKIARKLAKRAAQANTTSTQDAAEPTFLTLTADDGVVSHAEGLGEFGHELVKGRRAASQEVGDLALTLTRREQKLLKRMGVAGSLSYCFDSIRDAQRSLMYEAKREGGDLKDKALAEKLGTLAQTLAGVIEQKASHEGAEALDFSDADDHDISQLFLDGDLAMAGTNEDLGSLIVDFLKANKGPTKAQSFAAAKANMKKAKDMRKAAQKAVGEAHAMHKAAYLAKQALVKAGKKPADDDGDFDHAGAMEKLQKAFSSLDAMKTFAKAASQHMAKAAGNRGPLEGTDEYTVPTGVKGKTNSEMSREGPGGGESGSEPPILSLEGLFPGKAAKTSYTAAEVAMAVRLAAAEGKVEALEKMPAMPSGGRRPALIDTTKLFGGATADETTSLFKGVNPKSLESDDEEIRKGAVGKVIGNMILNGHGKSVFDAQFHGTAGASAE